MAGAIPYGLTLVAKPVVSGSAQITSATLYAVDSSNDTHFIGYGDLTAGSGGGWSFSISWTDPQNNAQSVSSSGGTVGLTKIRAKAGTNITYSVFGGTGAFTFEPVLTKL